MHVVGVIAEYNPFHNGHKYHLEETRRLTKCDYLVAVMSGAFTQRGEPALADKWTRARMALVGGADLVLELPAVFALRTADHFARGGVAILSAMGVDGLSFGCETGSLRALDDMSRAMDEEPPEMKNALRKHLKMGKSHARARGEALAQYLQLPTEIINAPNTVLAIEYLRANRALQKPLKTLVIKRTSDYHSEKLGSIASAGAIRAAIYSGHEREAFEAMPAASAQLIKAGGPLALANPSALDNLLLYRLRALEAAQIAALPDVSEGLEMRVKRLCLKASGRRELLEALKCKRYTMSRLSRLLAHALLGMDRALTDSVLTPPYARVLGFRDRARPLLREMATHGSIPLVSSATQLKDDPCFRLECRATDVWGLLTGDPLLRQSGRDFTQKMPIVCE
jgi:predicted nucleotidyltransferase